MIRSAFREPTRNLSRKLFFTELGIALEKGLSNDQRFVVVGIDLRALHQI